jgi:hypothetical protein
MKKFLLIAAILVFTGTNCLLAQQAGYSQSKQSKVLPIPSYHVKLDAKKTMFQTSDKPETPPQREKREMDVVISTSSNAPVSISATVWIVKENSIIVDGPYTIYPDEVLTVPIDNEQWGVVISSDWNVAASVWIQ